MDIDNLFEGMGKAPINGRGNYMSEGLYLVEIKNIFVKEGYKGKSFICEFAIVESNNEAHAVGVSRSWTLNFAKKQTFGDISKLFMALLGDDPKIKANQDNPQIRNDAELYARAVCGSDKATKELGERYWPDMFIGEKLRLECSEITVGVTKETPDGHPFTVHDWSPIPEAPAAPATA